MTIKLTNSLLRDFLHEFLNSDKKDNQSNQYFNMGEDKEPENLKNVYKKGKMGPKIKIKTKDTQLNEIHNKGVLTAYAYDISYGVTKNRSSNTNTTFSDGVFMLIFKEEEYKLVAPYMEGISSNLGYLYTITSQSAKAGEEKISQVVSFLNVYDKQFIKGDGFIAFQGTCSIVHTVSITENATTKGPGQIVGTFKSNQAISKIK